jgi:hypothetical protein
MVSYAHCLAEILQAAYYALSNSTIDHFASLPAAMSCVCDIFFQGML